MDEQILIKRVLPRDFYRTDGITLARSLIGKVLVHKTEHGLTAGVISETEAYMGVTDKASHAYNGRRTERTETMYLPGGFAYVYLIYGIYSCMNITANKADNPEAVLIRGAVPLFGFDVMLDNYRKFNAARQSRQEFRSDKYRRTPHTLTDGPGKLCAAMKIDRTLDKLPLFHDDNGKIREMFVCDLGISPVNGISEAPRIGIDYAEEAALFPWRYTANLPFQIPTTVQDDDISAKSTQSKPFVFGQ